MWEIDHNKGHGESPGEAARKGNRKRARHRLLRYRHAERDGRLENRLGHLARGLADTEIGENCEVQAEMISDCDEPRDRDLEIK